MAKSLSVSISASGTVDDAAVEELRAKVHELKNALLAHGITPYVSFSPAEEEAPAQPN
jgi:hypothetical protein